MPDSSAIPPARAGRSRRTTATTGARSRRTTATTRARSRRTTAIAVAVAVLATATVAGCGQADAGEKVSPPKKGGTVRVVLGAKAAHLDPQRIKNATETNLSRLTTRTLTTFRSEPGKAASEIVGDLATDTGRPSDGNTIWEFTLKPALRWEDGSPVTCADVKYGVERSFSNLFQVAMPYARQYLRDNDDPYKGPFVGNNNLGKGLQSVECVDQKTIRFHLKMAVGDFGYTVALPVFAPVPPAQDKKDEYDRRPFSNGPYKLDGSDDKQLVYVRNKFWDPASDAVRKAYPERIVVSVDPDVATTTNNLINSEGDWADAIALEKNVAAQFVQQVINDPALSARAVSGSTGGVRYFAINTRTVPDLRCRQALGYAFNKRKYRAAAGGATFGDFATTMIAPDLAAHRDFDLFGSLAHTEGDQDKALALRKQAADEGRPCPATVKLAFPDQKDIRRQVATVVESYQLIGVEVVLNPLNPDDYFDLVGNPANGNDLIYGGWIPDWANGSAVIPPLFDGRLIPTRAGATSNLNFALLNDPEINSLIDQALAESKLEVQYNLWGQLDEKIQAKAVTVPVIYIKALRMAGANVRGGFIHPQFGQPDLCALGLADPSK
ncbi:ABC transporter substrate-binding protein [Planosporangium sp. 12N6]|uniref:ABC transporter substrate-binding protein n=1 Tax=Planosporangium spinosum TaxID=3402278 RepID=UPI003CF084EB